jgi:uncharacterized protein
MIVHHKHNSQGSNDDSPVVTYCLALPYLPGGIELAKKFEGHIGVNIIRPTDPSYPEYIVIFRFNTYENLTKWERSQIRKDWLAKGKEVVESELMVQKQRGVEVRFAPHSGTRNINADKARAAMLPPPRYKMAILMTGIIFILLNIVVPQIRQLTMGLPILLGTFVGVAIIVLLMNYVIMPPLTKLLRPWLDKKSLWDLG